MDWLSNALGITIHWSTLKPHNAMRRCFVILVFVLLSAVSLQAQFAKPLKNRNFVCNNTSAFSIGVTGSFAANDMLYTSVSKALFSPYLGPMAGLAMEWKTMQRL